METFGATFRQIIEARLAETSETPFSVEQRCGLPPDSIRNVLRSESSAGPTLSKAKEICDALGLDFRIEARPSLQHDLAEAAATSTAPAGYATIPWHRYIGLAAEAPVSFSRAWLDRHRIHLDRTAALPIGPRSPGLDTFAAFALVDVTAPASGGPDLWAVADRGAPSSAEIFLEQVQFDAHATVLLPGPTRKKAEILPRSHAVHARLLGRVLWLGKLVAPDPMPA